MFTYVLFLGIGVGLFYLATLDITQGALPLEEKLTPFRVGSGLGSCSDGDAEMIIEAVKPPLNGKKFRVIDESGIAVHQGILNAESLEYAAQFCIPEGSYSIELDEAPAEGATIVLSGVNRVQELKNDMSKASIPGIVISFVLGYLAIVSRGIRWRYLLEPMGYKAGTWNSIHAVAFAYFANTFVPRSGEVARCAALNQTDDIPVDRLFGTVISERVIDMLMLLIFMAIAVFANLDAFSRILEMGQGNPETEDGGPGLWFWILVLLGVLVAGVFLMRRSVFLGSLFQKLKGFLAGVSDGVKSVLKMKRKWPFILHTLFIWVAYYLMAYIIYMSIEATSTLTPLQCMFIVVAGGFGIIIPAPGGIGSFHWTVKLGFIALGYSGAVGFAVANVLWLTQTLMIITGGGIGYLALMWVRLRKDRNKAVPDAA